MTKKAYTPLFGVFGFCVIQIILIVLYKPTYDKDFEHLFLSMISLIGLGTCSTLWVFYTFLRRTRPFFIAIEKPKIWCMITILMGIILRILWWDTTLTASEDAWRYLWDGALQWKEAYTYVYAPQNQFLDKYIEGDAVLNHIRSQIGHAHIATIYPPAAQLLFKIAYGLHPSLLGVRILLLGSEIFMMIGIIKLLRFYRYHSLWVGFYAFNPLVIFEVGHGTHLDAWGACAMIWGLYYYLRTSYIASGALLALGGWIKLIPWIILGSIFLKLLKRSNKSYWKYYLVSALTISILCCVPFLDEVSRLNTNHGLYAYTTRWRFNDSLFALGYTIIYQSMLFIDFGLSLLGFHTIQIQHYALIISKVSFMLAFILVYKHILKRCSHIVYMSLYAIITLLLISPVVFSWYLIWIIALMPVALASYEESCLSPQITHSTNPIPVSAWVGIWISLWTILIPLTYLPRISLLEGKGWQIDLWWPTLEYIILWFTLLLIIRYNSPCSQT